MPIALDTSFLIGLLDPKDRWHTQATVVRTALQQRQIVVVLFDCVLAEAISTMARRIHEQRRNAALDQLMLLLSNRFPKDDIVWILPDVPQYYDQILDLVRSSGGELNFNDALIALSCQARDIPLICSFDRDFDRISWLHRIAAAEDLAGKD